MSLQRTSLRPQPRAPHPFSVCIRQAPNPERFTPSDAGLASLLSHSYKRLFTPSAFSEGRSSLFSYSYKRLGPQLLSFDTHTNAPGVYRATRVSSSTLCSLFRSLCKERKISPLSSMGSALFAKNNRGVPQNLLYPEAFPRGANLGIAPSFLPTFRLRYTRPVASRSLLPWTSASLRPTPPSQI